MNVIIIYNILYHGFLVCVSIKWFLKANLSSHTHQTNVCIHCIHNEKISLCFFISFIHRNIKFNVKVDTKSQDDPNSFLSVGVKDSCKTSSVFNKTPRERCMDLHICRFQLINDDDDDETSSTVHFLLKYQSMAASNCLHILYIWLFCVQQKAETLTGLQQRYLE